jgi:hypothetical protein
LFFVLFPYFIFFSSFIFLRYEPEVAKLSAEAGGPDWARAYSNSQIGAAQVEKKNNSKLCLSDL